ncbi:Rhamnogalacturonan acetylesterase Short=RGAE; Flags: Precursor [Serendipita indica DSM 11827]|uniref:Probable rhamnogalacturonan acetyl esterase n=1 Tax=Serendipita indica (strain DSM 11827) TaxID=1109443 RepID=G4TNN3_SERID|nr:Rhamnogalacturonan acetylesterase Short=RGAE; Flags: Precursor [Serendipita indica DSM 11827]CCA72926.1 probable rhamnogalacturonan acetyl esterase [Serendipita indica DSM 11827]
MASHSASEGIQGWGVPASSGYFTLPVVNRAKSGSSARSWIRDGFWYNTRALLKSGDYVVIELGHNDGGGPTASTERGSVVGEGSETVTVRLKNGTTEVVHTFSYYIGLMINDALAKGAHPIVSSATPNNPYENSATIVNSPSRFEGYAKNIAAAKGVPFVSHYKACINVYSALGKATTESYFPKDHTHTNAAGATQVAIAFIGGLKCSSAKGVLSGYLTSSSAAITAKC